MSCKWKWTCHGRFSYPADLPATQSPVATDTPEGILPYMGYIGMCSLKGYGFPAVLVINTVLILAILVSDMAWCLHSSLEWC